MNTTVLLAAGGVLLGVALAVIGTVVLGRARAVARHSGLDGRARADRAQYGAGLTALLGFLAAGAGAALAARSLLPLPGTLRLAAATAVGVAVFAVSGTVSARVANRIEERRAAALRPVRIRPASGPHAAPGPDLRADPTSQVAPGGMTEAWPARPPDAGPPDGAGWAPVPAPPPGSGPRSEVDRTGEAVRPGWVYQDQRGAWYMGVSTPSGDALLLELPAFSLAGESRRPVYPLDPAGAGEVAVVPLPDADGGAVGERSDARFA